jgi:integrase
MPLSEPVRAAILEHLQTIGTDRPESPFFRTARTVTGGMDRPQAHRVLVSACAACGIPQNRISTHVLRKVFAHRVYSQTKCLITLQRLLGHRSPVTTARYLESDFAELDRLVLGLAA